MAKNQKSANKTYKMIELVGTSRESYEDAIENAIGDAAETLEGLDWFEVTQFRGAISDGKVAQYQATLKVGFRIMR